MIKANELRSGNLVQGKPLSIPRLQIFNDGVTRITAYGIHFIESEQYTDYRPIPLTEEWLIKCGFVPEGSEVGDDGGYELGKSYYEKGITFTWIPKTGKYVTEESIGLWLSNDYGKEDLRLDISRVRYVHQLQNLYFAIMGKELEIKL